MKVFSKFKVLGVALATLVAVGLTACGGGGSPSVEVEKYQEWNQFSQQYGAYIRVRAIEDEVVVKNVVVNRGNMSLRYGFEPMRLKFGQTTDVRVEGRNIMGAIKEVSVTTDKGTWTFNF